MNKHDELRIAWLLRKLQIPRMDPSVTRLWANVLAGVIVLLTTFVMAFLVYLKMNRLVDVFVNDPQGFNRDVTRYRIIASIIGGIATALALLVSWVYRREAKELVRTHPYDSAVARFKSWLCAASAAIAVLMVVAFFIYGPQYI